MIPCMKAPEGFDLSLRVMTMPRDTNHSGTVFGGVVLSYIDQAAYMHARRLGLHRWVTKAMEKIEFIAPVGVGESVTLWTRTEREGRTSATIRVLVHAERFKTGEQIHVTEALVTMVAISPDRKPIDFRSPATLHVEDE
jgi:acyl-CoA thioesterase YciA